MKQIILGTAGHIDHGKTTLIKALTGIDTDRLKEEKERGITIELGFAHLALPNGQELGIVDVPGHEKFVRHMVAGATGIDLVALVVAADEGVMPQTREHLEICELLKVKQGIVILTKTDLVEDADWLELVKEDIQDFLQGTFLASAPIISVSAVTGDGLDSLLNHLQSLCDAVEARSSSGDFRLAVDRVFTMKGFGTVITGTAISGKVKTGSTLFVYPQMLKTKVRGIQVHNREVSEAVSGQRTAINLQGLEKAALERGNVLATPESLIASFMVDVRLQHLETAPRVLKNRAKVRLHTGTNEELGTLILLDTDELKPGASGYAQVRMDRPVVVRSGDRFVLRSYSPMRTIGGGQILHPAPKKRKRMVADTLESLAILQKGESGAMAELYLRDAGFTGIGERELSTLANITVKQLRRLLQELMSRGEVIQFDRETPRFVHRDVLRNLCGQALIRKSSLAGCPAEWTANFSTNSFSDWFARVNLFKKKISCGSLPTKWLLPESKKRQGKSLRRSTRGQGCSLPFSERWPSRLGSRMEKRGRFCSGCYNRVCWSKSRRTCTSTTQSWKISRDDYWMYSNSRKRSQLLSSKSLPRPAANTLSLCWNFWTVCALPSE
jgi:selenocysteine-specific elongation factor